MAAGIFSDDGQVGLRQAHTASDGLEAEAGSRVAERSALGVQSEEQAVGRDLGHHCGLANSPTPEQWTRVRVTDRVTDTPEGEQGERGGGREPAPHEESDAYGQEAAHREWLPSHLAGAAQRDAGDQGRPRQPLGLAHAPPASSGVVTEELKGEADDGVDGQSSTCGPSGLAAQTERDGERHEAQPQRALEELDRQAT